jgi:hypothetical protein
MRNYIFLALIFILALYLRTESLGGHGFWIDECLYIGMVQKPSTQEFIPSIMGQLSNTNNEFSVRLPFALAGVFTVISLFWVTKNKDIALLIALFYAVCPLFVFWDRMARPYSMAGLLMVIAWRYPVAMIGAIFCTPIAMIGLNLTKIKTHWMGYLSLIIIVVNIYFLREDANRGHFQIQNILNSSRWFYLPCLTVLLYLGHIPELYNQLRSSAKK